MGPYLVLILTFSVSNSVPLILLNLNLGCEFFLMLIQLLPRLKDLSPGLGFITSYNF
jgi:hypothetical protein